jgi:hypothetical protein
VSGPGEQILPERLGKQGEGSAIEGQLNPMTGSPTTRIQPGFHQGEKIRLVNLRSTGLGNLLLVAVNTAVRTAPMGEEDRDDEGFGINQG